MKRFYGDLIKSIDLSLNEGFDSINYKICLITIKTWGGLYDKLRYKFYGEFTH